MVHKRWGNLYRRLKSTVRSGPSKPDAERWQRRATSRSKCSEQRRAELRNSSDAGDSQPLANQAASPAAVSHGRRKAEERPEADAAVGITH